MNVLAAIQSIVTRPQSRSDVAVDRELDEEFAFGPPTTKPVDEERIMLSRIIVAAAAAVLLAFVAPALAQQGYPERAPFTAVRWSDNDLPEVRIDDAWYGLISIDGTSIEAILVFCGERYPGKKRKRFSEDLVQVLAEMGKTPGDTVDLGLRDLETGRQFARDDVPMTDDNRRTVWRFNNLRAEGEHVPPHVERARGGTDERFAFLAERVNEGAGLESPRLSAREAVEDLDRLEAHFADRWSYYRMRGVDYQAAIDTIRAGLGDGIGRDDFAIQLQKLIALAGDGHAGVHGLDSALGGPFANVLLTDVDGRVVAFLENRASLLDPTHPYVRSIDGVDVETWIEAAGRVVPEGAPQQRRKRALRTMRYTAYVAREMGRELSADCALTYELESEDGTATMTQIVTLTESKPQYGSWPRMTSTTLEDDIGYLRLATMNSRALRHVAVMMPKLGGTDGLIIDVRGNGGGSRMALRALASFLVPPDSPLPVVNVAKYRLSPAFEREHLGTRFMYRAEDGIWDEAALTSIAEFAPRFAPEWPPPDDQFSEWHYLVLDRSVIREAPHYAGPVVVLMDGGCFSATDIFLGALDVLPNVTLLGTPSAGGSGRSTTVQLPNSGLEIRLSSMASFRPDGRLYDGRGIEPDVVVHPEPAFFLGNGDAQLDAAVELIKSQR